MAWFYEIRNSDNSLLKREGGFSTQEAAKSAVRGDAKNMKKSRQPGIPIVGTMRVGQNAEIPTR